MCGFHGSTRGFKVGKDILAHRGPDNYGLFEDDNIALEHWRLSIVDLSPNGNQPMVLEKDCRKVIAYNGEVYNFRELRKEMTDVKFKSTTDTEVILHLYDRVGLDFLQYLNGMFALAIYDKSEKCVILARDRFGVKPLYYRFDDDSNLSFASELKALRNGSSHLTLDATAIQSLFHLLYIQGDRTPFSEIKKVLPGCCLIYHYETKRIEIKRYHRFNSRLSTISESQCIDGIANLLSESVKMNLISDVPVGALLSGGVDSSLMVALMSTYSSDISTYSVGYGDNHLFNESKYSSMVAARYKTRHHNAFLSESQIGTLVGEVCAIVDEPIGDTSVFLNYFIFGFVSKSVKVCLSGLGGDELFGGYNRYLACKLLPLYWRVPRGFRGVIASLISFLPSSRYNGVGNKLRLVKTFLKNVDRNLGETYCNFVDYFANQELSPVINREKFANPTFRSYWEDELVEEVNRIYKYDIEQYMSNDLLFLTDRMSMSHSLEVRVPYLENQLVDFAMSIPPEMKIKGITLKYLLKEVARRYLPKEIVFRRKQGFSSPISTLLGSEEMRTLACELSSNDNEYVRILNRDLFLSIIGRHRRREDDYSLQIFTLIVYLKWMQKFWSSGKISSI